MRKFIKFYEIEKESVNVSRKIVMINGCKYRKTCRSYRGYLHTKSIVTLTALERPGMPRHVVAQMEMLTCDTVEKRYFEKCKPYFSNAIASIRFGCEKFHKRYSHMRHTAILSLNIERVHYFEIASYLISSELAQTSGVLALACDSDFDMTEFLKNLEESEWLSVPGDVYTKSGYRYIVANGLKH